MINWNGFGRKRPCSCQCTVL